MKYVIQNGTCATMNSKKAQHHIKSFANTFLTDACSLFPVPPYASHLSLQPEARERFSNWRGRDAATKKLPTLKLQFLLGFRPLYFENAFAKQYNFLNILKLNIFSSKLEGRRLSGLKVGGATAPAAPLFPGPCLQLAPNVTPRFADY